MKYFPLIWGGLWRKKTRTTLTFLSIIIAFLLFGLLQGVNAAFRSGVEGANVNRLYVQSKIHFTEPLPSAYLTQLEAVKGVTKVAYATWFGPYYQNPHDFRCAFPRALCQICVIIFCGRIARSIHDLLRSLRRLMLYCGL